MKFYVRFSLPSVLVMLAECKGPCPCSLPCDVISKTGHRPFLRATITELLPVGACVRYSSARAHALSPFLEFKIFLVLLSQFSICLAMLEVVAEFCNYLSILDLTAAIGTVLESCGTRLW